MPSRPLTPTEIAEARLVFDSGLDYTRARVAENAGWPDWVDRLGLLIQGQKPVVSDHNAITVGNTSYFPVVLRTAPEVLAAGDLRDMTWLIHELTHQWQFQHLGWRYLRDALSCQLRYGRRAYDYKRQFPTREDALKSAHKIGQRFAQFNPEQQGDLARDYYFALKQGVDHTPWDPFIADLRQPRV